MRTVEFHAPSSQLESKAGHAHRRNLVPGSRSTSDRDLVSADDQKARFDKVVLPHLDDAYALARWLTGNRTDAEDVVQEACLRAFNAIGGFADGNARAWVLTIVRHTAYTWLHKNRPAALVMVDDLEAAEQAQSNPGELAAETPESILIAKTDVATL